MYGSSFTCAARRTLSDVPRNCGNDNVTGCLEDIYCIEKGFFAAHTQDRKADSAHDVEGLINMLVSHYNIKQNQPYGCTALIGYVRWT
ncbi:hypothetical protein [Staphylococcus phage vB_SauH_DELF3]|nr:hypothetical protein [Staphylococcus phage vB_SauH_DELF3]